MFDEESGYRLFLGFLALVGLGALAFGAFGLYMVLSGGTDGGQAASIPDGFECDTFHGDPDVGHEAAYGITRNTTLGAVVSINGSTTAEGFELTIEMADPSILNASGRQADGTPVPVEIRENNRIVVAHNETNPFRLWIDTAEEGTITRSQLDICPPEPDTV